MATKNRILIVVDPTGPDEQSCVARGAWIADKLGLGVELLICDYEQYLSGGGQFLSGRHVISTPALETLRKQAVSSSRENLERIAKPLVAAGQDVLVSAVWDTPLDEGIIRHVLRTDPKIVVKETHYHSKLGRTLFAQTDWNLVRLCPVPLWLAKTTEWPDGATILASVDPTHQHDEYAELDDQILDSASMLAEGLGCELHAFHSFVPISAAASTAAARVYPHTLHIDDIEERMRKVHTEQLNDLVEGYPVEQQNIHMLAGAAQRLLPPLAEETNAGLVVMGSIARNALHRVFIGSTTEKVLDKLPCDLLVVKPQWFDCPVPIRLPDRFDVSVETSNRNAEQEPKGEKLHENDAVHAQ